VAWSLVTVGLPVAIEGAQESDGRAGWLLALQFTFFLALAIVFDLRDSTLDPRTLRTIPQVLGPRLANALAALLLLYPLSMHLLLASLSRAMDEPGITPTPAWEDLFGALGYLVTLVVVVRSRPDRGPLYFGLLLDGVLVLVPLLWWLGPLI
jgi:hypothetical protein